MTERRMREAISERFWLERLGYLPDRPERAAEFARMINEEGLNLGEIGELSGLSFQRVSRILQQEGIQPQRLQRGRPSTGASEAWYVISDRLLAALKRFPVRAAALREGLAFFAAHPEQLRLETVGVTEESVTCSVLGFTEADLALIAQLSDGLGYHNRSAVIRNCIEWLIEHRDMTAYRKPPDWQSRPLSLKQGGLMNNPNPALPPLTAKTLPLPLSYWHRLAALRSGSPSLTYAGFVRAAIDQACLTPLAPLTPAEAQEQTRALSVRIFVQQRDWLQQQLDTTGVPTEKDLLLAIIKQHLERLEAG